MVVDVAVVRDRGADLVAPRLEQQLLDPEVDDSLARPPPTQRPGPDGGRAGDGSPRLVHEAESEGQPAQGRLGVVMQPEGAGLTGDEDRGRSTAVIKDLHRGDADLARPGAGYAGAAVSTSADRAWISRSSTDAT